MYIYQEVGFLDYTVTLLLVFWGPSILFPILSVPVYITINSAQGFPFLHILRNTVIFLIIAILTGGKWYFNAVVICIPLMISGIIFSCAWWQFVCHLYKYLFRSFAHFILVFKSLLKYTLLQCCINFCYIAKWLNCTYMYTFSYYFPLRFIVGYHI